MVFNSFLFAVFFAVVLAVLPRLSHRAQNRFLLAASFLFYSAWDWRFVGLLLITIIVDYTVGLALETTSDTRQRKLWLAFSLVTNLGILGFFKYWNFFSDSAEAVLAAVGLPFLATRLDVVLPVGLSFYTFQSVGYTINRYRRQAPVVARLEDYALFVSYFPLLLAGPIERSTNLVPQLLAPRSVTRDQVLSGSWLILWGLFKKVVIADNLGVWADTAFAFPAIDNGLVALLGLYAFALQLYGDFSGYSDMARGVSRLMGIELMVNFSLPYAADSPVEFWRRWHISLSTWLRDFLFLPMSYALSRRWDFERLLGLRVDIWIYSVAIVATMLLGGLWHGAAWTFVLWGLYHGLLLAGYRLWAPRRRRTDRGRAVRVVVMFHLTCAGWLLFRAESLAQVKAYALALISVPYRIAEAETMIVEVLGLTALVWMLEGWLRNVDDPRVRPGFRWLGWVAVPLLWAGLVLLAPQAGKSFVYFQF